MYGRPWSEFNPLSYWNWVHKLCSGITASLRNCEDFICNTYSTTTGVVNPFPTCIKSDRDEFKLVGEFCYLGDVIGQEVVALML